LVYTPTYNDVTPGYYYWDGILWQRLLNNISAVRNGLDYIDAARWMEQLYRHHRLVTFNIRVNNRKAGRIDHLQFNTFSVTRQAISTHLETNNTASEFQALYSNTVGRFNTANGSKALYSSKQDGTILPMERKRFIPIRRQQHATDTRHFI